MIDVEFLKTEVGVNTSYFSETHQLCFDITFKKKAKILHINSIINLLLRRELGEKISKTF